MEKVGLIPFVPAPMGSDLTESFFEDCGDGNIVKEYLGATRQDYENYLSDLESEGFSKFSDNGDGIGGTVFTATYVKGLWQITVLFLAKVCTIAIILSTYVVWLYFNN